MDSIALTIFIAVALSWLISLSGVALGGWLVFRTKRESYEGSFFGSQPKGEVFTISDGLDEIEPVKSGARIPTIDKSTEQASERFLQQFEDKLFRGSN